MFQKGSKTPIIGMFDAYRIKLVKWWWWWWWIGELGTSPGELGT